MVLLTEQDSDAVAALFARCADYFLLQDGEPATQADAGALFHDVPSEKSPADQTVFGWRDAAGLHAVVAILRDYPDEGLWYLGFAIVGGTRRGQGIGRTLCTMVMEWAREQGAREIRVAVLEDHAPAERFWRSLGFRERRRIGPDLFKTRWHRRIELMRTLHLTIGRGKAARGYALHDLKQASSPGSGTGGKAEGPDLGNAIDH